MKSIDLFKVTLLIGISILPAFNSGPMQTPNPLLIPWRGPFGGVPPFDKVQIAHFKPALEKVMNDRLKSVHEIASNEAAPNFENTIVALERTRNIMDPVRAIYGIWGGNLSTPQFQAIEMEMAPRLSAIEDQIFQNEKLYKRIKTVYDSPEKKALTPEQQRLVWLYHTDFVRAGAQLDNKAKQRLTDINQALARLYTQFKINVLADETNYYVVLEKPSDLEGLPESLRDAAASEAERRNLKGKWVISNTRSSVDPFLQHASNRALREKVWQMFVNRGDNGDEHDNNKIISDILKLRLERAQLLGYETHAHWRLENTMAKTPANAIQLLEAVWAPAIGRVADEVKDMQQLADKEGNGMSIEPWDYQYYMAKVRQEKYALDQNEVKEYLQLEKLREGMFYVAGELFDFRFTRVSNVPVYHPDVTVWEVTDSKTGDHVGLFYFDPFARQGKRSGAWMNAYRTQERMDKAVTTIVSNNSNYIKGRPGEPVLISWDDARTLFHEFGHALHGLASRVTYPSLAGTAVFRDYVEFPSQLLEHWLTTPEVLNRFARHYKTDKPIPQALVDKIARASTFNQGFATTEYLASAYVDIKFHLATDTVIDPDKFERETLADLNMPKQLVMRHRSPQFMHIFSGDSYSAGYYSYLWADVLTADAYAAFLEEGGPYNKAVSERLRKYVFSAGNTIDPAEGYRLFRKRDAKIDALMKERGFTK